ncbi:hypothetical protein L6452_30954 [Arctium lappa]|uniref:Uncharacterized protein n=1 Tax=Arctium lappa TaxID=4217 RepID=A0ACB8ZKI6_ARCLA|nr:hypothetical protein L6452_30954 [Arctium lappa]
MNCTPRHKLSSYQAWTMSPEQLNTYVARRFHISRSEWDRVFSRLTVVPGFNPATGSLRLPCYDFTPVKDPTVVCANKNTKSLCGTCGTEKSWVIIGPMLQSSALAAIKLKRTLEKKGLRLRKAPTTFLLTAQLRAGTQLVELARHSAPRLTSAPKIFSLGACLNNTKRGPSVADHPKRPAKRHWLGQPLPDQLPNTTHAHQIALFRFNAMGEKADMKAFIEVQAVGILFQGGPHDSS